MSKLLSLIFLFVSFSWGTHGQPWKKFTDSVRFFINQKQPDNAWKNYFVAKGKAAEDPIFMDTVMSPLKDLAQLFYAKDDWEKAIAVSNEIRSLILKDHDEMNADYAWACNMLGVVYNLKENLDTAKAFHFKAKEIRERLLGDSNLFYAQSCNNLGSLYRDYGQFDEAEVLLLKAKEIRGRNKEKSPAPYAITCTGLANLYRDMGQFEKAEELYSEAKNIRASLGKDNPNYASSCYILADLYSYTYMGQPEKSEALYLEAMDIIGKIDDASINYGQICNNLASLYRDMGKYKEAEKLAIRAGQIFKEQEDERDFTINLNSLGELNYAMGRYKKAESYFLMARSRWRKALGTQHPYYISNSDELVSLYWKTNDVARANDLFTEVMQSKYKQLNKIFRFTSEKEKQLYLKNINGANDSYQSFFYKKRPRNAAGQLYDMSLMYRNLILSSVQELRQTIYNSKDSTLNNRYGEWLVVKKQLANLYAQGAEANLLTAKELESRADDIEKVLTRSSSAFEKMQGRITWQNIRNSLQNSEAAVEFIDFRLADTDNVTDSTIYGAIIVRKNLPQPLFVPLFEKKRLDALLEKPSVDERNTINDLYSSQSLFNSIWKPLEKYLGGVTKVFYAPSGDLFRVSFSAIPLNDSLMISDRYRLVQLNTTASVIDKTDQSVNASDNIQLYGGIDYDADTAALRKAVEAYNQSSAMWSLPEDLTRGSSFRYLPGTKEEIDEIKKQADKAGIKATALSGVNATKESFLSLNDFSSPSVLHIATHGFFFDNSGKDSLRRRFETSGKVFRESQNPLFRVGLLFAGGNNTWRGRNATGVGNGVVTAYEISSSMYLPNTKLVVLSACETARGHIEGSEGVYGLQRAFKIAGAQNLVMSLWKVPDAETSEFMQTFYKNMFDGQSVNDAFYNAQKIMKDKYRNDPYKWAAWILVR